MPRWWPDALLVTWFVAISVQRLLAVIPASRFGFDGRLYVEASRTWLQGGNPWEVSADGVFYAAPPPSLVPTALLVPLPTEAVGLVIAAAGLIAMGAALRSLQMPLYYLAFPPFVDGLWNANPDVVVVPLLVAGGGLAIAAAFVKLYAAVPPVVAGRWRVVLGTTLGLVVTAPLLPWPTFLAMLPEIAERLASQSTAGLSATSAPLLIPVAVAALLAVGRERASWLVVPALWPSTQWYYATLTIPGLVGRHPSVYVATAIAALPVRGAVVMAAVVLGLAGLRQRMPPPTRLHSAR